MFTGIVEEVGNVKSLQSGKLTIEATEIPRGMKPGDSVNVNGACLTVTGVGGNTFSVEMMPETLRRTNIGALRPGQGVNLERALAADGRFGGHFVQGHVDGTGKITTVVPEAEALVMRVTAPAEIMNYIVEKGFIAVDGISLTVVKCDETSFTVSLVAYTQKNTTLLNRKPGDAVNLEIDIMAKYAEKMKSGDKPGINHEFLSEHGFLST
ncbi:MAG TPA: riboflavin synthase [Dehalococcoidia bacterium]|nr:riboflavin synthase [Dehalococcoidia bacterium]